MLRDIFDLFDQGIDSAMAGLLSPAEASRTKITRVTFNHSVKPLLTLFPGRSTDEIYEIINFFLLAITAELTKKTSSPLLSKPVVFRAFMGIFRSVAQRVVDKNGSNYSTAGFQEVISPIFSNLQLKRIEKPGTSWTLLRDFLHQRLISKLAL